MQIESGKTYQLKDGLGRQLGSILVTSVGDKNGGVLSAGPGFPAVREIFHRLQEAVDGQMLSIWDEIAQEVEGLCPSISSEEGDSCRIFDLHIKEPLVSFRMSPFEPATPTPENASDR